MKIIACSDNHNNLDVIEDILNKHQDADYYFHLGDSEFESFLLKPFASVMGNNDIDYDLPNERIIDTGIIRIYLTHGHTYSCDLDLMSKVAKTNNCQLVLFGHSHEYLDTTYNGIRFINPGSCKFNRINGDKTYVVINVDKNGKIDAIKQNI